MRRRISTALLGQSRAICLFVGLMVAAPVLVTVNATSASAAPGLVQNGRIIYSTEMAHECYTTQIYSAEADGSNHVALTPFPAGESCDYPLASVIRLSDDGTRVYYRYQEAPGPPAPTR